MGRRLVAAARLSASGAALLAAVALAGCNEGSVTAPALSATCSAQPSTGPAPLAVAFTLSVAGAEGPFSVDVSYGDGTGGTNPDQPHTYANAGTYTASFTVTTATQSARCATTLTVGPSGSAPPSPAPPPQPSPAPGANQPPVPVFKSTPAAVGSKLTGKAPFSVRWNMCATSDADGDLLWFRYDYDGDGEFDREGTSGANCRNDHVYAAGTWYTKLCVHDVGPGYERLHPDQCASYTVTATP